MKYCCNADFPQQMVMDMMQKQMKPKEECTRNDYADYANQATGEAQDQTRTITFLLPLSVGRGLTGRVCAS